MVSTKVRPPGCVPRVKLTRFTGNSLPRHLRPTLMTVPSNGQLLETTALPFALLVQPFAQLRYDEAPIPLVSSWVSGQSAFDRPPNPVEDEGPPRCEKCRGYVNPWVRFTDGGQKWLCNLCNTSNPGEHIIDSCIRIACAD